MPSSRKSFGLTGRKNRPQATAFGRELRRLIQHWRAVAFAVIAGLVIEAIRSFVDHQPGRGGLYLALAFAEIVLIALVKTFDWSWLSIWLYRLSLPLNVVLVLALAHGKNGRQVAIGVALFTPAFLAGLYLGRHEADGKG